MDNRSKKLVRWLLVAGAVLVLLALAASLSTLEFRPAWEDSGGWIGGGAGGESAQPFWWGRLLMAGSLLLLVTLIFLNLLLASKRQRPLPKVNYSALGVVLMLLLIAVLRPEALKLLTPPASPEEVTSAAGTPTPAPLPAPPALSEPLLFGASLALALLLVVGALWLWQALRRPAHGDPRAAADTVQQQLAQTAQAALHDLQGGENLSTVILRCYQQMSQAVAEKRDLYRAADMTPREFVQRMERAGVPGQPVEQLTALFEAARYGARTLDKQQEAQALACLRLLAEALEK